MQFLLGLIWMAVMANGVVPLRFSGSHVLVDGVYVNGEGPFRFLLDTGAETTSVTPRLASRIGLQTPYAVEVFTLTGGHAAAAGRADVTVGDAVALQTEVVVQDLALAKGLDQRVEGVLGQSFLGRFRHLVDYANARLSFQPPRPPQGVRMPIERADGGWVVRAGGRRLLLDSGSTALILFAREAQGFRPNGTVELSTVNGRRNAAFGRLRELCMDGLRLRDLPVVLAGAVKRDADGLLPLALFRSVYVDPMERWVILDPVSAHGSTPSSTTSLAFLPAR
ncbi:MAG: aspartyl protease family protein [Bryobacterales bacterium]|nr:aspartyl protease family protein [Bryobacterales bacterium]